MGFLPWSSSKKNLTSPAPDTPGTPASEPSKKSKSRKDNKSEEEAALVMQSRARGKLGRQTAAEQSAAANPFMKCCANCLPKPQPGV